LLLFTFLQDWRARHRGGTYHMMLAQPRQLAGPRMPAAWLHSLAKVLFPTAAHHMPALLCVCECVSVCV